MIRERQERVQGLPFPTRPLAVGGGIIEEYVIPDEKKKEVLKKMYPFVPVPSLDDRMYDVHEGKTFLVREYRVVREGSADLLVSPYYPSSGGTVIDWDIPGDEDAVDVALVPMKPEEAEEVSRLVLASIRAGLAESYPAPVVEALAEANSPEAFLNHAPKQTDYVLRSEDRIFAMMGLKGNEIGHLYVHPDEYENGFGSTLVWFARNEIRKAGHREILVLSSLNAVSFYEECGFTEESRGSFEVGDGLQLDYVRMTSPI